MKYLWLLAALLFVPPAAASLRVVSLAPFLSDLMIQLEAEEQLVGVLDDGNLPDSLAHVARVGGYQTLSPERILALRPDLVLAWTSGNPPELLSRLEQWGITVERFDPQRLDEIADTTLELGRLVRARERAEQLVDRYRSDLARLHRPVTESAPRVFIQLWDDPLYTASDQQLLGDALRHCGAHNVFGSLRILAPQVGREHVIAADPELIIAFSADPTHAHPWLQRWRQFPQLHAVRNKGLKSMDGDSLVKPTPRVVEGLEKLCALVHGDAGEPVRQER